MIIPAMGTITVSDRLWIMEKIPLFHSCGVWPTCAAMSPVFALMSENIVVRLELMVLISTSFSQVSMASKMPENMDQRLLSVS